MSKQAIVVGGGIAGLTAACELLERGCNVLILEKSANLGGNSSKATCGIAAPGCELQKQSGIQDTGADLMSEGIAAKELITNGTKDVEWLLDLAGVKDEMTLRLTPGHGKTARTLGTAERFPGQLVTYAVIHQLEELAKAKPNRLTIKTSTAVTKILTQNGKVTGVEYSAGSKQTVEGVVLLSTGGFAGDGSPTSLLAQVAPEMLKLPSTNDERTNGDGITLATAAGAGQRNMNALTLYPMAAVVPGMEQDKFKICLSDAICGAGGCTINADGMAFIKDTEQSCSRRSDAMMKSKAPFRVVLPESMSGGVEWLCNFYVTRKVMKKYRSAAELAKDMKVPVTNLKLPAGPLFVAVITPALYSCAGGISTGFNQANAGKALTSSGTPVEGLYAAGEVSACDYPGLWSVSGIPLLYCIYSGRMAARGVAEALGAKEKVGDFKSIASAPEADKPADKQPEKKVEDMSKDELLKYCKELEAGKAAAPAAAPAAPAGISEAEVAKHKTKEDAWVIINGEVIDVTKWIPIHPGGEKAIEAYLGKDATEEWNMIHKKGTVEKNAQHLKIMGKVGGGGGAAAAAPAAGGGDGGMSVADVAKHNTPGDAWIILFGEAIDVTKWIPIHPGGEQAIKAYLGKDATEEWVMIHKPGTVEKNMQHLKKMGKVSGTNATAPQAAAVEDDEAPPPDGDGGIKGILGALVFLLLNVLIQAAKTVFFTGNFKFTLDNNRKGTIRSAIFLLTFTIVHALGNFADMLSGPDEVNGEGYMFDRIHWTGGFGLIKDFPFSVVEEYLALGLLVHVSVALKRTWDLNMGYTLATGKWNMALSGLVVLFFLIKHLQDFRFYPTYDYMEIWAPDYMINFRGIPSGRLFAAEVGQPDASPVKVRDLYSREVALFKDINSVLLYTACIVTFVTHMCLGWKKLVPADRMQIPRDHHTTVKYMGWVAAIAVGGMYLSVPWYVFFAKPAVVHHV